MVGSPYQRYVLSQKSPTAPVTTSSRRKKGKVIASDDASLRGTEGPICQVDPCNREVCCLPGGQVKDITAALRLLSLLIFHVDGEQAVAGNLKTNKRDFHTLRWVVRISGI